jgi:hypothetical protein
MVTRASPVARFTDAAATPETFMSPPSMRETHAAQWIPSTERSTDTSPSGGRTGALPAWGLLPLCESDMELRGKGS